MLELFKQEKSFLTRSKEKSDIKYVVRFDTSGAYLEVCDAKLKPLKDIDYRVYSGLEREILQAYEVAKEENFFTVSWEDDSKNIYLHKYPRLLELLRQYKRIYTHDGRQLTFRDGVSSVVLKIEKRDGGTLETNLFIDNQNQFDFLTPNYALVKDQIVQVHIIGENFSKLKNFATKIKEEKLEEFLTILFTHFENIEVEYESYEVMVKEEQKVIKPAVIFEKITPENELVLRTSATVGKLSPDFFNDFNISKIVLLNEIEHLISIYECDFTEVFDLYSTIYTKLNRLKRDIKDTGFSEEDGLFVIDEALAKEFILHNLQHVLSKAELFGSEKLKSYKYNVSTPSLNVNFKDKIDFLGNDDVNVSIGEDQFNVFDLVNLYKKHSYIPLSNGENAIVEKSYIQKLERIFKKEGQKIKVSFFDLPEIEELIHQKEQKVFQDSKKFYEGFNALKSSKKRVPKLQNVEIRSYQKEGVKWLKYLYDNGFGGCLADDMGLGKTLQAIMLLSYIYPKTKVPSLVVMPRSLLTNWQNELQKFNPNLSFYLYYNASRDVEEMQNYNIVLTTYAIVRNDIEKLKNISFDTIILDESQNIKNVDSKISKAVMLLEAKHKFALSGTPIENSLFELYSLFRFINSGLFATLQDFKRDYAQPIQGDANEEVARILKAKISPFLLRRLKQEVLTDLPSKQEQVVYVEMSDRHKQFYNEKRDYYRQILEQQIAVNGFEKSSFMILQAFNDLRQIASAPELKSENTIPSSKIDDLFEMLEEIIVNNHKVLIFANFLGSLDLISEKANELGYEHLMMTGSTKNRQELVDKFQNDKNIKLFLMTLKVGGVGLNLTEADYVFIFDPWWNQSAENQAIDRAHRMGQKNTVFAYKMITKGTIEEKILELQMQKKDMTDMVISGDEGGLKQLSSADLEYILG